MCFQKTGRGSFATLPTAAQAQPISPTSLGAHSCFATVLEMFLLSRCRSEKFLIAKYDIISEMEQEKKPHPWRSQTNSTLFFFFWEQCMFSLQSLVFSLLLFFSSGPAITSLEERLCVLLWSQSDREMFQVAIRLTGHLKSWLYADTKTLWSKLKDRHEELNKMNYCNCVSEKWIKIEASAILQLKTGQQHETCELFS